MRATPTFLMVMVLPAAMAAGANASGTGIDVALAERAAIAGPVVMLDSVAEIRATTSQRAKLVGFTLGPSPRAGLVRHLSRAEIEKQLARAGIARDDIRWSGAQKVVVERKTINQGAEAVEQAAKRALAKWIGEHRPDVTRTVLEAVDARSGFTMPAGEVSMAARVQQRTLARRMCVWVELGVDGRPYSTVPVWFDVRAYKPVVVATRNLKAQERIGLNDVSFVERDVTIVRGDLVAADASFAALRARRAIGEGAMLLANAVEPLPMVIAEQQIDVRVTLGRVVLETKGVAEEEGGLGDLIQVRNPESEAVYRATVVGERQVAIAAR